MKSFPLGILAKAMGGELHHGDENQLVSGGICTDTRKLVPGSLFFALRGENFDAHDFIPKLGPESGLSAVVAERMETEDFPTILVPDSLAALQKLAKAYLTDLLAEPPVVVAITGSSGKTSTKELLAAILREKFRFHATAGNLNNHIGVPLTILSMPENTEILVLEMGMNHAGELAPLCEIAKPQISIITNIGRAHIEFLGSRQAIAAEKATVARYLPKNGHLVIPDEDDFADYLEAETSAHCDRVAIGEPSAGSTATHFASALTETPEGWTFQFLPTQNPDLSPPARVHLPLPGRHMVVNALLAAAAASHLEKGAESIVRGLSKVSLGKGRLHTFQQNGITVFDDTYNANPDSVLAALETLAAIRVKNGGRKIAVLGHMAELGDHGPAAHREVGQKACDLNLELIAVGELATEITTAGGTHFSNREAAANYLKSHLRPGDAVLFKGSRTAAIEKIITQLFPEN